MVWESVCAAHSSVLFSQGSHEAFHFKGLLLITTGGKISPQTSSDDKYREVTNLRHLSKFTQHWSPGYSYGFLLKWYLKTTFDFCSFFLFLKLEPIKSSTAQHRRSNYSSATRTFDSEQPSCLLTSISCQMGPWAII